MPALARVTDLPSSHAGAKVANLTEKRIRLIVERLLLDAGTNGLTDRELTIAYFANPANPGDLESPRKRRSDLTRDSQVLVTPMRRKTAGERVATQVWVHRKHYTKRNDY